MLRKVDLTCIYLARDVGLFACIVMHHQNTTYCLPNRARDLFHLLQLATMTFQHDELRQKVLKRAATHYTELTTLH
jgi:hypothetical protein